MPVRVWDAVFAEGVADGPGIDTDVLSELASDQR
jgi:hypothetical protein